MILTHMMSYYEDMVHRHHDFPCNCLPIPAYPFRFGSVNRKALDQYTSFTEQREELTQRKAELDRSEAKIRELIHVGVVRGVRG